MIEVIYILWLRQLKHYWRSKARLIGSLGQPLLFMVAFGFGFGPMYTRASGGANYMDFLAPGIVAMSILFTAIFSGLEVIWDRQFGFLKETLVAPISRTEIMLGKTFGGATIAIIQGLVVLCLTYLLGFRISSLSSLALGMTFMFLIAIFFTGLGLAIASMMKDMQGFQLIMNFLIMPIFFLSGALFPLENLPSAIYFISRIDPLTYGVDGMRGALAGMSVFGIHNDFAIMFILSVLVCIIGAFLFSRVEA
ncbi:ABC transporter permease [Methanosarcina mazei]|uniref:Multidrug ABC transporter, permease protein n=5 Tax=Methanosarcina mazei TaxID=2209 RepID=A0A0E3PXI8_METMZ|nr:ABC transporter permease [Methanosarcina mazei]AAM32832.1 ABC transporter, permease protein [Methanosarcina mazei Go1]AKB40493.1 multidrug ABC transporter, permease protein [Methanosarcina mazei WWM610]AKB61445.1 multidrug ABC transporter, permease protein [Methanosarcina mazei SarPi]AKB64743.1 multidrug ABC transporter, permease protein [Methanosarcina mazei S-6]KKH56027.1 multidrug ABC transporter permease [Methanosarcina mazei]